jgi:CheY-like chemotaxis protein
LAVKNGEVAELFVVADGTQVIEYLDGEGVYGDRKAYPFPDLVVLDLKMPLLDGLEVLTWIRTESAWPRLPVVLLSGSGLEKDVEEAYRLGANSYFQKPHSVADLKAVLRLISEYWALTERPKGTRHERVY